jgi:hypothetical protein
MRALMVRGVGIADIWPNVLALMAFAVFFLGVASMRFRKQIA